MLEWCNLQTLHSNYFVNLFVTQVYPIHTMTFFIFLTVFGLSVVFPCKGKVCTWEKHYMDMGVRALSCLEGHKIGLPIWLCAVCYIVCMFNFGCTFMHKWFCFQFMFWPNDTGIFSSIAWSVGGGGGSVPPLLVHLCKWKPII